MLWRKNLSSLLYDFTSTGLLKRNAKVYSRKEKVKTCRGPRWMAASLKSNISVQAKHGAINYSHFYIMFKAPFALGSHEFSFTS